MKTAITIIKYHSVITFEVCAVSKDTHLEHIERKNGLKNSSLETR